MYSDSPESKHFADIFAAHIVWQPFTGNGRSQCSHDSLLCRPRLDAL